VTVRVRFFAILRDLAGVAEVPLELDEGATVARATEALLKWFPALREHLPRCAFAVNRAYVKPDVSLNDGDELALIPPVSGG